MPKNSINDYDNTADNNTDIGGINTGEGWAPSVVNNAFRELMAHIADWVDGTVQAAAGVITGTTTDNTVPRVNGTAGQLQSSGVIIDDNDLLTAPGGFAGNKGADLASAGTLVIGTDGDRFDVTGTTTITAMTVAAGRTFTLQFDGALTLTHGGSLVLPGAANITTAAGDRFTFYATAANTVECIAYALASGEPLVNPPDVLTTQGDILYRDGSGYARLAAGTSGQVLQTQGAGANPQWADASSGATIFTSAQQTITAAGSLTIAHGLGQVPEWFDGYLVCTTAEGNYSIGDKVWLGLTNSIGGGRGASVTFDATNLNVRFGSNTPDTFRILNKTTGADFGINVSNWEVVFIAGIS